MDARDVLPHRGIIVCMSKERQKANRGAALRGGVAHLSQSSLQSTSGARRCPSLDLAADHTGSVHIPKVVFKIIHRPRGHTALD